MDQGMAPEDHLCLLLARGELSPGARKQALELLASPLRWDVILRRAAAHQVFPLLFIAISEPWTGLVFPRRRVHGSSQPSASMRFGTCSSPPNWPDYFAC